jgi:uncharacterized membrane protein YciS (DUF1049 family)
MHNFIRWVVGLPIAAVVIAFAIANRQRTIVSFDPFNRDNPLMSVEMPLWALFFLGLIVGVFTGWIACWVAQGKWRRSAKEARRELARAHSDLAQTAETKTSLPAPADTWS